MKLPFPALFQKLRRTRGVRGIAPGNPVVRHWELLFLFGVCLLIGVSVLGYFLFHYFLTDPVLVGEEQKNEALFDEKKLEKVIERFQKRETPTSESGSSSTRFIDPSIPF